MLECSHRRRKEMKYVVLVSHGEFAKGLANALAMLAGEKMNSQKYSKKQ